MRCSRAIRPVFYIASNIDDNKTFFQRPYPNSCCGKPLEITCITGSGNVHNLIQEHHLLCLPRTPSRPQPDRWNLALAQLITPQTPKLGNTPARTRPKSQTVYCTPQSYTTYTRLSHLRRSAAAHSRLRHPDSRAPGGFKGGSSPRRRGR